MKSRAANDPGKAERELADRIHSAAIHLLRRLRAVDRASGLSAPRLSALSVIVFAGPIRVGDLAEAEQVRPPTISRMVNALEDEGLVTRILDPQDSRAQLLQATAKGRRLLQAGKERRVAQLAGELVELPQRERRVLLRAAGILESISLPQGHPRRQG